MKILSIFGILFLGSMAQALPAEYLAISCKSDKAVLDIEGVQSDADGFYLNSLVYTEQGQEPQSISQRIMDIPENEYDFPQKLSFFAYGKLIGLLLPQKYKTAWQMRQFDATLLVDANVQVVKCTSQE